MKPAIHVRNLSKQYQIGSRTAAAYSTLREALVYVAAAPLRRLYSSIRAARDPAAPSPTDFWALSDVSFEAAHGEVVGIIGGNGAGKSTLLKILSRITEPTSGRIQLFGRVACLLEVGTGFHPELTGRENVFLNGAILGMSRLEIGQKFDEIVAFSEVEQFIDTPVKRYSSGMYVRLAFAIAAHLNSEILIIDEVLAVGDAAFQRKCLGRMREISGSGRTVLFVSHSMATVESLCDRVLLLDRGRLVQTGEMNALIQEYNQRMDGSCAASVCFRDRNDPERREKVLKTASMIDAAGRVSAHMRLGDPFHIRLELEFVKPISEPEIGIYIDDSAGQRVLSLRTPLSPATMPRLCASATIECRVAHFPLAPGTYWIKLTVRSKGEFLDSIDQAMRFTVTDSDPFAEGRGFHKGVCIAKADWNWRCS